jgi:hypothetical protein
MHFIQREGVIYQAFPIYPASQTRVP